MKLDQQETKEKNIPIQHFFIDFRYLLLKPKIEQYFGSYLVNDAKYKVPIHNSNGMTEHELSILLQQLNQAYGKQIDNQHEVSIFIDFLFERNLWIIKTQFFIFMIFFFIPFMLQLFTVDNPEMVITLNTSCLII